MKKSYKPILRESSVLGQRKFIFPKRLADGNDPITRKPCIRADINQQVTWIPVEEPVSLTFNVWSMLKNIGYMSKAEVVIDEVQSES